ncbi:hypothetical protein BH11MYX4_BH11MYX4_29230 [soil metagenome]
MEVFDVRQVPALPVLMVHATCAVKDIPQSLGRIFRDVVRWAGAHHVDVRGPAFARYTKMGGDTFTFDAGFGIKEPLVVAEPPITPDHLGGCLAAHAIHIGPYEKLGETYGALERWFTESGYSPAGAPWEAYLTDPTVPPSERQTEIFWPIRRVN